MKKTYGTTEYVANMIWQAVSGNVHRIETVTPIGRVTFDLAVFDSLEGREEIIFLLV